jgi:hypothetical protein
MHTYPADALFASRTQEPIGGPSLSDAEIVQLYQWWLGRPPDPVELSSERENAWKYSAAGIERQIANRSGNVASSGIRGDEGAPSLTVAAPIVSHADAGNVATAGASAASAGLAIAPSGPTGLVAPWRDLPQYGGSYPGAGYATGSMVAPGAGGGFGGLSLTTIAIGALVLGAGFYLWKNRG